MAATKFHPHPIAVHFSNGLIPVSVFFLILFWITGAREMETTAFYTLVIGTLGSALSVATGLIDWKAYFKSAWVPVFRKKLTAGILAIIGGTVACTIRYLYPDLLYSIAPLSVVYITLNVFILGCVTVAGHLGGKLVFH